jgi:hypothetical protein
MDYVRKSIIVLMYHRQKLLELINIFMALGRWDLDGRSLGSCPAAGFYVSGVNPSRSATKILAIYSINI